MKKTRRDILFVFSILFAVFIYSFSAYATVHDVETGRDKFSNYYELQQILSTNGMIKVIVKLDVPWIKELTAASINVRRVRAPKEALLNRTQADTALKDAIASTAYAVLENLEDARFQVSHIYSYIPYMSLEVSEEALAILESLPEVLYIQRNKTYKPIEPVMDKQETKDGISKPMLDASVKKIGAENAHLMGYTGMGYYVAVLDSGILRSHEFFNGKHIIEACFSTGTNGNGECPNGGTEEYGYLSARHHPNTYMAWDHGTKVAGIAVGDNGTLYGVARDANLIAVQVSHMYNGDCDPNTAGTQPCVRFDQDDVVAGLDYVFGLHGTYADWNGNGIFEPDEIINIAAVNLSFGGGNYSTACNNDIRAAAIGNLQQIGIPTIIASGNNGYCGYISAPACVSDAVAVGASTMDDAPEPYTNWHEDLLELLAPGENIKTASADSNGSYDDTFSYTSAATPHVAGAWALLKQAKPDASVRYHFEALRVTGVPISPLSGCAQAITSKPRIQVDAAITATEPILTTPNKGEIWECGTEKEITWFPGDVSGKVKLVLRRQNGSVVGVIADNINADACFYPWDVGTLTDGSTAFGTDCIVRLEDMNGNFLDDSDVPFTITGIKVNSPNGGERWQLGLIQNITWDAGGFSGKVKIVLRQNNSVVGVIQNNLDPNSSPYPWEVGTHTTGTASTGSNYVIRVKQMDDPYYYDDSDAPFSIGKIEVTSPNGGEGWRLGSTQKITWNAEGLSNNVKIVLWKDGKWLGNIVTDIPPTTTSYNWTVGQYSGGTASPGSGYTIRVREQNGSLVYDDSDASFSIGNINVISPIGGENWPIGSTQNITWNAEGISNNVKLVLWKDGNLLGVIKTDIPPTTTSSNWTVGEYSGGTAAAGSGYTIRVREQGGSLVFGDSNPFTLVAQTAYVYFDDFNRSDDANLDGDPLSGNPTVTWDAYNAQVVSLKARPLLKVDSIMKADILMNVDGSSAIIIEADALVMEPSRTFSMGFPNIENGTFGNYGNTMWLEVDYNGYWRIKTRANGVTNTLNYGQFSGWINNSNNHYKLDCHILTRTVDLYFNGQQVVSNIYVSTPVSLSRTGFQIKRWSGLLGPWQGNVDNFKVTIEY